MPEKFRPAVLLPVMLTCLAVLLACNPLASAGMASAAVKDRLKRIGQGVLEPSAGLAALAALLRHTTTHPGASPAVTCVNPFSWPSYFQHLQGVPAVYQAVAPEASVLGSDSSSQVGQQGAVGGGLEVWDEARVRREVEGALQEVLGTSLRPDEPLMSGGSAWTFPRGQSDPQVSVPCDAVRAAALAGREPVSLCGGCDAQGVRGRIHTAFLLAGLLVTSVPVSRPPFPAFMPAVQVAWTRWVLWSMCPWSAAASTCSYHPPSSLTTPQQQLSPPS